jgi:glycosyltransferase involved in cell wall biosynthesis
MKIGFVNPETWIFLQDIYDELAKDNSTDIYTPVDTPFPIFKQRLNQIYRNQQLRHLLNECDVVIFEWASDLLAKATNLKTKSSGAIITRLHRFELFEWTDKINWEAVDYVILDTQAIRSKLLSRTNFDPQRAIVIPPIGLSEDKIDRTIRPITGNIGILATLHPRKRIYELILAFNTLLRKNPQMELHIGGHDRPAHQDYYEALHYLVEKLNITEKVKFHGRVEDRWSWYQSIDIFISNSYSEGMQVAPLEAAASGCYCLSHWWEGADEIFSLDQLYLSEQELIEKITRYYQASEEERQRLKEPLRNFIVESCNIKNITSRIKTVIDLAYNHKYRLSSKQ